MLRLTGPIRIHPPRSPRWGEGYHENVWEMGDVPNPATDTALRKFVAEHMNHLFSSLLLEWRPKGRRDLRFEIDFGSGLPQIEFDLRSELTRDKLDDYGRRKLAVALRKLADYMDQK